ncbi:MAG: nucleotidyltransferase family protein [Verrucomicrobiales bacterium]|nr:nucleotidyltransferase family protein [Verrucomicrobiales bacterium]
MTHPFYRNVLPNAQQTLLLKACLLEDLGSSALALEKWLGSSDIDALDYGSFRLLPMLWKRSAEAGWDLGKEEGRIRGIYRYSWSKYQILNRFAVRTISRFNEAQISVTLLKGFALSRLVYDDPVCRPFGDIDLFVSAVDYEGAINLLKSERWTTLQIRLDTAQKSLHAIGFHSPDDIDLDLHRHILESFASDDITASMISRQRKFDGAEANELTLCFEDHFVHACAHGAVYSPWPQIRWLADTSQILRHCRSDFDWDLAISTAEAAHCMLPFQESVLWLRNELEHPIPEVALEQIATKAPSLSDKLLFRVASLKTPEASKFRHRVAVDILHFHRQSPFRFSRQWITGLKCHLIATNNFDCPAKDLFRRWIYLLILKFRNLQFGYLPLWASGMKNWSIHRDSISRKKESEIFGFHLLECDSENRLLRWSSLESGLFLRDLRADFVVSFDTLNCRPELIHETDVTFSLNGVDFPPDAVEMSADGVLSIQVKRPYRPEGGDAWLIWRTSSWKMADSDPRELGVPVYSIRRETLA